MTTTKSVICTVDVVLLTIKDDALNVALLKRDREPFEGSMALPGGYIHPEEDKDAQDAAVRVLREKTRIESPYLEQLGTFADGKRDPRGWSVSIAYYALVPAGVIESAGGPGVHLHPVDSLRRLPFDHAQIIRAAVERVRSKSTYSSLPVFLCGEEFSKSQLQKAYEAVLGEPLNKVTFRRKLDELDILEPVPGAFHQGEGRQHRPAQVYRVKRKLHGALSLVNRGLSTKG